MTELEIKSDPALETSEKETMIRMERVDGDYQLTVHSEHAVVVKWLLQHPDYEQNSKRVSQGIQHATTGTLPVGALKLSGRRQAQTPGSILGQIPGDTDG